MKKVTIFIAAAFCITTATYAQNTLNLKKGQKYIVENKLTTVSNTEVQGQSMETTMDVTTNYNVEVTDATSTGFNLKNKVAGMLMNMNMMGQSMDFDSKKQADLDGPIGSSLKDYINKDVNVVIDKSGKVVADKDEKAKAADAVSQQFQDFEASGYGAELTFEPLPADLKVGSTWTSKVDNPKTSRVTNFTVKSISGNLATLSLTGTTSTDMKMEQQGMELTTKTTGTFTGEEIVDIQTGVIQSNKLDMKAAGNIEVMGQEIPTSSVMTSITTVKSM